MHLIAQVTSPSPSPTGGTDAFFCKTVFEGTSERSCEKEVGVLN
jgi:hypothetical protein